VRAVNLIPAEQRRSSGGAAGRSGGIAYVVVGLLAGIAVLALLYGSARHSISTREGEAAKLSAEAAHAEAEAAKLAPYTRFAALREERLATVRELADTRFDWAHAMHELGRVLPSDVALTSMDGQIGAAAASSATASSTTSSSTTTASAASSVTSATPPGSTPVFTIAGCATTQSEVALAMDRLRLMDGVSEVSLKSSTKAGSSPSGPSASGSSCPDSFNLEIAFEGLPTPSAPTGGQASQSATTANSETPGSAESTGANGTVGLR